MFKKMMIPALVLAAASVAVPAAAQSYGPNHGPNRPPVAGPGYNNWQSINQRQAQLDRRIDQGVRSGQLSRREATRLRSEFNSLVRLEGQYRRGGLSAWEMEITGPGRTKAYRVRYAHALPRASEQGVLDL